MNLTDYQAEYFAYELTRRFPPDSVEKVTVAFAGAQVDLNPHQIDAALLAFKSPLSRGALLADDVKAIPWDLVVIDEAHWLRHVYKPSNVIANTLKVALAGKDKLLLTATPLQNSLLELFGPVSFIDEHTFGDLKSFRQQFANLSQAQVFDTLKARIKPICHRTLRRQVMPYIKYTQRLSILERFTPEESEDRLYHLVSDYLRRENLQALPSGQRTLMTLVLRKLLASSTFAIAGAISSIADRLKRKLIKDEIADSLEAELDQDYEALASTADEWGDDAPDERLSEADRIAIEQEIDDLETFTRLATSITHNAKGLALLRALKIAFAKLADIGAEPKAVIFTESRRHKGPVDSGATFPRVHRPRFVDVAAIAAETLCGVPLNRRRLLSSLIPNSRARLPLTSEPDPRVAQPSRTTISVSSPIAGHLNRGLAIDFHRQLA